MHLSASWLAVSFVIGGFVPYAKAADTETTVSPVEVARLWLEALRAGDSKGLKELSALPIKIKGFNLDSGPEAVKCGAKPRGDGLTGVSYFDPRGGIELLISDDAAFERGFQCMRQDNMLVHYIPESTKGSWPRDRHDFRDNNVGEMRLVKASRLARRLKRYRVEVKELPKTDFAVQARMTDNNGVTNHVLVVVAPEGPEQVLKVRSVYIDELFEE